jgi:hypothetical protein
MNKHYVAVIGFASDEVDKKGNAKITKFKYIVRAMGFYEAVSNIQEYLKGDVRDHEIVSLAETKFEDVVGVDSGSVVKL